MQAVGATRLGGPEVLDIVDLPMPSVGMGQVLVRVTAAAVNPTDTLIRSGAPLVHARQPDTGPWVPGMDLAGVVVEVGEGMDGRLMAGQEVVALVTPHGTHGAYAHHVVLPAESVVAAPRGVEATAASALIMNAVTAQLSLDALSLRSGDSVLVTGGAGTLGGYVIELARAAGLEVLADAAPSDVELVRSSGASLVLPRNDDLAASVRGHRPAGVVGVVDAALLHETITPALADRGRLATVREWDGPAGGGVDVRKVRARAAARDTALLERLVAQCEAGVLTPRVADVLPAAAAAEAHRRLESGGVRGRLVLDLRDLD